MRRQMGKGSRGSLCCYWLDVGAGDSDGMSFENDLSKSDTLLLVDIVEG